MEVYEDHNSEKVMKVDPREVPCPESVVRKNETPVNIDLHLVKFKISFSTKRNKLCSRFVLK